MQIMNHQSSFRHTDFRTVNWQDDMKNKMKAWLKVQGAEQIYRVLDDDVGKKFTYFIVCFSSHQSVLKSYDSPTFVHQSTLRWNWSRRFHGHRRRCFSSMRDHRGGCGSSINAVLLLLKTNARVDADADQKTDKKKSQKKNTDTSTSIIWSSQVLIYSIIIYYPSTTIILILEKKGIRQAWASKEAHFSLVREIWICDGSSRDGIGHLLQTVW